MESAVIYLILLSFLKLTPSVDSACSAGSVQIVGGTMGREGRAEVCYNNQWGTICDDNWGTVDARVFCRHIGYPTDGAVAFQGAYFGEGTGNIWLDNVYCVGTEGNIFSCPRGEEIGSHNCDHSEDAGVRCPPCVDGNVVFIRGTTKSGVPMLCNEGSFGTICDNGWDENDAKVICRMLGYPTEGVVAFQGSTQFNIGYGDIFVENLGCTGDEERLTDCPGDFYQSTTCTHNQDAALICPSCGGVLDLQLWSAYAATPDSEGMLQICTDSGQWRGVCTKSFGCTDAKVACRDLGFSGSTHTQVFYNVDLVYGFTRFVNPFRYDCTGSEVHFTECARTYDTSCDNPQWELVGVRCESVQGDYNCTDGDVRFRKQFSDSDTDEGRVEYCYEHHWTPFCVLHDEEATVICKSKGHLQYTWAAIYEDERYGTAGLIGDFNTFVCNWQATESSLAECNLKVTSSCTVQECATEYGMQCFDPGMCDEGTFRLVDGDIEQEGRVEVCYYGVWGAICDTDWNEIDAYVLCRQLGYDGGLAPVAYNESRFQDGIYPIVWSLIDCQGWEKSIMDCTRKDYLRFSTCSRFNTAGVLCAEDCVDGDVRLVNGDNDSEGTVEVCYAGLWGLVDQGGWDDDDASVVCWQLGYSTPDATAVYNSQYGRPNKTIHLVNVNCQGTEGSIEECTKTAISLTEGKTIYKNHSVAGVDCHPEPPTPPSCTTMSVPKNGSQCTNGEIQLQNGGSNREGRLVYCHNGLWTPFCYLDERAATVACKQLGFNAYTRGAIITTGEFGSLQNYSLLQNISCSDTASETTLGNCYVYEADCLPLCPGTNIGLRCFAPGVCSDGTIQLADGLIEQEGRVEVCIDGVWGTVCDDGWDKTDAHVACQQLGHPELEPIAFIESHFGDGQYPIVYSNMDCIGSENSLADCSKSDYLQFSCPRSQVAGVLCGYDCNNGDVQLIGGSKDTEGTVEVCYDNLWGLITDSSWDEKDAKLICKLLGFSPDNAKAYSGSYYGKPAKTIMLSDVQCSGEEAGLDGCAYTFYSLNEGKTLIDNIMVQVAGVSCLPAGCIPASVSGSECTSGNIRLDSGSNKDGNLQYCINGTWSPFCSLELDEASVACREKGFTDYDWAAVFDDSRFNPSSNLSYFQSLNCSNDASSFASCNLSATCTSECSDPLAIRCYERGTCEEGSIQLMDGALQQEGRVEVCLNGVWGSVCDSDWDQSDGLVACSQFGFDLAEPLVYSGSQFGDGYGPIVYSNLKCNGFERDLGSCDGNKYPLSTCSRSNVAGVLCRDNCQNGEIQLVGGSDVNEGTVLMCQDGLWSMIGDAQWDDNDAQVVCRQLQYSSDGSMSKSGSFYGKVNKTLAATSYGCIGTEAVLTECTNTMYAYDQGKLLARNTSVAGVYCVPNEQTTEPPVCAVNPTLSQIPMCQIGDMQLFGGLNDAEGRLMYCYNGQWSPFCSVDSVVASVACKAKGYNLSTASIFTNGEFGNSALNYSLFSSISCSNSASKLSDCSFSAEGCVPTCTNNVGIRCYTKSGCVENSIRLADGSIEQQGRVEVCIDGIWSSICDDGWDKTDSFIVCKQLGFAEDESTAYIDSVFGGGYGPIVYSNVKCVGHESSIYSCPKSVYPNITCSKGNAAGVMCADDCNDGDLKLVGGSNDMEGTVEICFDDLWGLISDSNWGDTDAIVVCSQLGLETRYATPVTGSKFGKPNKTVHLNNVYCSERETRLTDCTAFKLPLNDGSQYNVAGVSCPAPPLTSTTVLILPVESQTSSGGVSENTLYVFAGILGVCAVLSVLSVICLFGIMFILQQKRKGSQKVDEFHTQKTEYDDGSMPLYSVVNRNRDSMVSFSSSGDGFVKMEQ